MTIKRHLAASAAVLAVASVLTAPAFAFAPGDNANPTAVDHCLATIGGQEANGVGTGGGPKADHGAPTNCDHYWQYTGTIGQGN